MSSFLLQNKTFKVFFVLFCKVLCVKCFSWNPFQRNLCAMWIFVLLGYPLVKKNKRRERFSTPSTHFAFLFCWLWKALLLHESLWREVFKDLQIWHFLCAMLFASEYICVLKSRAFQRPQNHILILNESECLWWSFMSPKGKTLKTFKLHFFFVGYGKFCCCMKA